MVKTVFQSTIEAYEAAFRQHGESPASVMWPKGRQPLRFGSLTRFFDLSGGFSVLDYGCGLADLKPYLDERFAGVRYCGADVTPGFVMSDRARYPDASFLLVKGAQDIADDYDYVVMSGVFNLRYDCSMDEHRTIVQDSLRHLFTRARRVLAVDFMTDDVDYRAANSYHQNVAEIYQFARRELGRRVIVDHSYMPYEYSLTVFKDSSAD